MTQLPDESRHRHTSPTRPRWLSKLTRFDETNAAFWAMLLPVAVLAGISVWGAATDSRLMYLWFWAGGVALAGVGLALVLNVAGRIWSAAGVFAAVGLAFVLLAGSCATNLILVDIGDFAS